MRKVIYTDFIPGVETYEWKEYQQILRCPKGEPISIKAPMQFIVGTNCTVEKEGWFHGIFQAYQTPDGRSLPSPMALIEEGCGRLKQIHHSEIRFVDSPEAEQLAEFSKATLACIISRRKDFQGEWYDREAENMAAEAVRIARALIAELNKPQE